MSKTVLLIPTYNERENIRETVQEVFSLHPEVYITVIDDNSPDGTGRVVDELCKEYTHLALMTRAMKQGLGAAYKDAIERTRRDKDVDRIITFDADGSHDPHRLAEMFTKSAEADLVVGSRYVRGGAVGKWVLWRRILSRCGNAYASVLAGLGIHDMTSGFLCMNRKLLDQLDLDRVGNSGYAFLIELKFHAVHDLHASATEIPILLRSRREGESKISHHAIAEGFLMPLRLLKRRILPTRV